MVALSGFSLQLCMYIILLQPACSAFLIQQQEISPQNQRTGTSYLLLSSSRRQSSTSLDYDSSSNNIVRTPNKKPDITPFNFDIGRTIFAPLFLESSIRHRFQRPSPFEDPSCAQTAERMLRRMMENRYRSDGRTVCPDGRTFSLVAGAFGRLRCKVNEGSSRQYKVVKWEEEPTNNTNREEAGYYGKLQMTPADKLQQLLQLQLQLCHREGWSSDIMPAVDMYNRVLKRLAWQSKSFRHQDNAAEQAWLWLQLMQSSNSQSSLPPNHITDEETRTLCQPNAITYMHVIDAMSSYREMRKSTSKSLIDDADSVISTAYDPIDVLAEQIDIEMVQSERQLTFEWFLTEAETLLTKIEDLYNTSSEENCNDRGPNLSRCRIKDALVHVYRCLIEGWGRYAVTAIGDDSILLQQQKEHATKRAHELLCRLEGLSDATMVPSSCYSSVMLALSISGLPSAATDAEDVLQRMMSQYGIQEDFNRSLLPLNSFNVNDVALAFSACIAAHAQNNDAPKAEAVLNRMIDLYDDGVLGADFVPEARAFGSCIALWGKYDPSQLKTGSSRRRATKKKGSRKDLPSYQQRLENADRAEDILCQLERVADVEASKGNENFFFDATPYNIAILSRVQTTSHVKRDKFSDNNYERNNNEQVILHAQSILDHMEYTMGVRPDPYTYSILLHAWCQQSSPGNEKAADYAEELLRRRIEDVDISKIYDDESSHSHKESEIWPNVKHYSSVLKAHAKTKSAGGAKKALALLSEMEQRFYDASVVDDDDEDGGCDTDYHIDQKYVAKPDLICYSIVIDSFANSRLPEASSVAYRLLNALETKREAGDDSMKANDRVYTAVILSLVHSPFLDDGESDKRINNSQRAWSILERMQKNDVKPNAFTYNYIINCAAENNDAEDQKISFEIALRAFQALRSSEVDRPDSFTFAFMIKACNNLIPAGSLRTKIILQTFNECCKAGYVNDTILNRLWQGVTREEFYHIVQEKPKRDVAYHPKSPIQVANLPSAWSKNSGYKYGPRREKFVSR